MYEKICARQYQISLVQFAQRIDQLRMLRRKLPNIPGGILLQGEIDRKYPLPIPFFPKTQTVCLIGGRLNNI